MPDPQTPQSGSFTVTCYPSQTRTLPNSEGSSSGLWHARLLWAFPPLPQLCASEPGSWGQVPSFPLYDKSKVSELPLKPSNPAPNTGAPPWKGNKNLPGPSFVTQINAPSQFGSTY